MILQGSGMIPALKTMMKKKAFETPSLLLEMTLAREQK